MTLEFGLDTFGDVTAGPDGRLNSQAQVIREVVEQAALADVAHDGEDALWMADATPFDVMVLDINLPGINGFETCQRLRASRCTRRS